MNTSCQPSTVVVRLVNEAFKSPSSLELLPWFSGCSSCHGQQERGPPNRYLVDSRHNQSHDFLHKATAQTLYDGEVAVWNAVLQAIGSDVANGFLHTKYHMHEYH